MILIIIMIYINIRSSLSGTEKETALISYPQNGLHPPQ